MQILSQNVHNLQESTWNLGVLQVKYVWYLSENEMVPIEFKENTHLWIANINKIPKGSRVKGHVCK